MGDHVLGGIHFKAGGNEKGKTTKDCKGEKIYLRKAAGILTRLV